MSRPSTPANVALQLRQEAFFGCCHCGTCIVDYHHIITWAEEQHFRPEDMIALCSTHHDIVAAWPKEEQYKLKYNPHNKRHGFFSGQMYCFSKKLLYKIGPHQAKNTTHVLKIDNEQLLSFHLEENQIKISAKIYDKNNNVIFEIKKNEWINGNKKLWDFIQRPKRLKVRSKTGKVVLEIDLRQEPFTVKGEFWKNQHYAKLGSTGIIVKYKNKEIAANLQGNINFINIDNMYKQVFPDYQIDPNKSLFTVEGDRFILC